MTDNSYLYEYFLKNSPDSKQEDEETEETEDGEE